MVTIYQGTAWDIQHDERVLLPRWRTRRGFEIAESYIPGLQMLEETACEVDDALVDCDGKTALGFDPK